MDWCSVKWYRNIHPLYAFIKALFTHDGTSWFTCSAILNCCDNCISTSAGLKFVTSLLCCLEHPSTFLIGTALLSQSILFQTSSRNLVIICSFHCRRAVSSKQFSYLEPALIHSVLILLSLAFHQWHNEGKGQHLCEDQLPFNFPLRAAIISPCDW